jgi:hypothetical protein
MSDFKRPVNLARHEFWILVFLAFIAVAWLGLGKSRNRHNHHPSETMITPRVFIRCLVLLVHLRFSLSHTEMRKRRIDDSFGTSFHSGKRRLKLNEKGTTSTKKRDNGKRLLKGGKNKGNIFDHGNPQSFSVANEDEFVGVCQGYFLSPEITGNDDFVSQNDFVGFTTGLCNALDAEELPDFECMLASPQFSNLAVRVQLAFVWSICPTDDKNDLMECLADLASSSIDFGYQLKKFKKSEKRDRILRLCCSLLPFISLVGLDPVNGEFPF